MCSHKINTYKHKNIFAVEGLHDLPNIVSIIQQTRLIYASVVNMHECICMHVLWNEQSRLKGSHRLKANIVGFVHFDC